MGSNKADISTKGAVKEDVGGGLPSAGPMEPDVRRLVINAQHGGFSLSPLGVKRYAELQGRECYFFTDARDGDGGLKLGEYVPISIGEAQSRSLFFYAFDIPNPSEMLKDEKEWNDMTTEERRASNALYASHALRNGRDIPRDDPHLLQVIEELGESADGRCAKLKIVEIPADVEWAIEEYDGMEWVAEVHRTWS